MSARTEFDANMAALNFIDRDMVPEITDYDWPRFRDNPGAFWRSATFVERNAIWRAICKVRRLEPVT